MYFGNFRVYLRPVLSKYRSSTLSMSSIVFYPTWLLFHGCVPHTTRIFYPTAAPHFSAHVVYELVCRHFMSTNRLVHFDAVYPHAVVPALAPFGAHRTIVRVRAPPSPSTDTGPGIAVARRAARRLQH